MRFFFFDCQSILENIKALLNLENYIDKLSLAISKVTLSLSLYDFLINFIDIKTIIDPSSSWN